jgi:hypothetical protein
MATFVESFILLSIGAVISFFLGSWLTNRWQDRRKELEIKVDVTSKMTEVLAYTMANSILSAQRKINHSNAAKIDAEDDESLRKFYVDVNVIRSKLASYFSEPKILEEWKKYYEALLAFRYLSKVYSFENTTDEEKNDLKKRLDATRKYFSDHKETERNYFSGRGGIDWNHFTTQMKFDKNLWGDVANLFSYRSIEIEKEVFNLPVKVFSKWWEL